MKKEIKKLLLYGLILSLIIPISVKAIEISINELSNLLNGQEQDLGTTIIFPYQGGTGQGSATAGDVGKYLKISNNNPFTYSFDTPAGGGGGGSGLWATSTDNLRIYPITQSHITVLGATATSSDNTILDITGNVFIDGNMDLDTGHTYKIAGADLACSDITDCVDWTADQGATNIHAGNYTDTTIDGCTDCLNATEIEDIYILKAGYSTGNLTSDLNIDSNTLVVDYDTNEVGIGVADPLAKLHIFSNAGDVIFQHQAEGGGNDLDLKMGFNGYGWYWRYLGSGSGDNNEMQLWSEGAGTTDMQAYGIKQSGNITFQKDVTVGGTLALTTALTDAYVSNTLTVDNYMQDEDINTFSELNTWMTDATLLKSGGTLTSGKICKWDGTGIDCDYTDQTGGGGGSGNGTTTLTICNAAVCNYTTDGTDDNVQIQEAIDDVRQNNATGTIMILAGDYDISVQIDIEGDQTTYSPMIIIQGAGIDKTTMQTDINIDCFNITDAAKVKLSDMTIEVRGSGHGIESTKPSAGSLYRAFWQSRFSNLFIVGINTDHTGWGMSLGSPFRSRFENIEMLNVGNGFKMFSEHASLNPGDCTIDKLFIETYPANSTAVQLNSPAGLGSMNQVNFNMVEMYANNSTGSTGILLNGTADNNHNRFIGVNSEEFAIAVDVDYGFSNYFEFNYICVADGGTVFKTQADADNNDFRSAGFIYIHDNHTIDVINDANTWSDNPNKFRNFYIGVSTGATANATINSIGGTVIQNMSGYNNGTLDTYLTFNKYWLDGDVYISGDATTIGTLTADGLTLGANENITLGAQTLDHDGTDFVFNDTIAVPNDSISAAELNEGDAFTWTSTHNYGGATSLEIPNAAGGTVNAMGEITWDSTDDQLVIYGTEARVIPTEMKIWSTTIASTSPAFIASGLLPTPPIADGYTITHIECRVYGGTNKVIAIEDASGNSTENITCLATVTDDDGSITNATYTASEIQYIDFGATSGSVNYVMISVFGTYTRE